MNFWNQLTQPIKIYTSQEALDYAFNKYLITKDYRVTQRAQNRVYDNYGMIDTLGSDSEKTANTFSYSCEGGCIHAVLSGALWLVCYNFEDHELRVFKQQDIQFPNDWD